MATATGTIRRIRTTLLVALPAVLAAVATGSAGLAAPPTAAATDLGAVVTGGLLDRAHLTAAQARTAGRQARVDVRRQVDGWAFGTAVLTTPRQSDQYPQGWLFLARADRSGWRVELDGTAGFADLAGHAPTGVLSVGEKAVLAPSTVTTMSTADGTDNTGLRLPFAIGQSWTLAGGPHGWAGTDTPYSSVDLTGGDNRVLAAGAGAAYLMCSGTSSGQYGGWVRVYHSSGYTTDYYHLWGPVNYGGGTVSEGTFLGNTGTDVSCGGSATGRHVHFAILIGTTRVAWNWRSAGKWVFIQGSSAYGGYALHGSTQVNVGGALYNYGALGFNQGIVDADGGGSVNKRSGPGTGYAIVGSVADGTTVTISCWRNGTTHTGRWGTTSVWDKLTDGTWISDAFAYTGTNTIGPTC